MEGNFKESLKVTKLFTDEELKLIKEQNKQYDPTFDENSEFFRPMGGKSISNDMSHLVSNEKLQEIFDEVVLGIKEKEEENER